MEGGRRKEEFEREGWRNGERESMREEGRETDGKKGRYTDRKQYKEQQRDSNLSNNFWGGGGF